MSLTLLTQSSRGFVLLEKPEKGRGETESKSCFVVQMGLEFVILSLQVEGLKTCTIIPGSEVIFCFPSVML